MKLKHIQISGIVLTVTYGLIVAWIYWAAPKNFADVGTKARESITNATSKTRVAIGTYEVDKARFNEGLSAFRQDSFVVARDRFRRADSESRDALSQFYIAYSFYRQGWGRISNDDELFKKGLEQIKMVIKLDPDFKSNDPDLKLKRGVELKQEFEEGLRITAADFNPFKLTRERK